MRMNDLRPRKVREGYWFARKRCGIGSVPATWQGWTSIAVFGVLLALTVNFMPNETAKIASAIALIIIFVTIGWMKTDGGWSWSCGDD